MRIARENAVRARRKYVAPQSPEPVEYNAAQSRCTYCASNLAPGAILCSTCGYFQDWRRWVQTSTANLPLMIALVSVLTTFVALAPRLVKFLGQPSVNLEISELSLSATTKEVEVPLLISNESSIPTDLRINPDEPALLKLKNLEIHLSVTVLLGQGKRIEVSERQVSGQAVAVKIVD